MNDFALSAPCPVCGSDQCPCVLSTLEECLVCSHLQGKDFCDCHWNKYCVYIDFLHNKKDFQKNSQNFLIPVRLLTLESNGFILYLTAPESVLSRVKTLDSVFLESQQKPGKRFPAVVLTTYPEHGIIPLAVKPLTAQEKYFLSDSREFDLSLHWKPAVLGLTQLQGITRKNVLVVAEGFGQLLADSLVKNVLLPNRNEATVLLTNAHTLIIQKLEKLGVEHRITGYRGASLRGILEEKNFDACCSLGNNILHKHLAMALSDQGAGIPLFISNFAGISAF